MNYIDGFILPIPTAQLKTYQEVADKVANIWLEYGALDYQEFVIDDPHLEGTRSFAEVTSARQDETTLFGLVTFASREARDSANQQVAADSRMEKLLEPINNVTPTVFDAERMVYGGFKPLVHASASKPES